MRFTEPKKPKYYYFEKWIFRGVVFAIFLLFLYSVVSVGFGNKVYAHCPNYSGVCDNPFFKNCEMLTGNDESVVQARYLCNQTYLFAGQTIGEPPTWFMRNTFLLWFSVVVLGFVLNHFLFNRRNQLRRRRFENG